MIVLELFAGTRSIGRAFERAGHTVYSVEWDRKFEDIALYADIGTLTAQDCIGLCGGRRPDIVWASPDCTSYSVAGIGHHRMLDKATGRLLPKTDYGRFCDKVNAHVVELIRELSPKYWFIENPVGGMRKMEFMDGLPRYTTAYCQWGDTRQKPTDIWTNHPSPNFKAPCKRGSPCHEAAPRGTRCGTQRLKGSVERARIPDELCEHIVRICSEAVLTVEKPRIK